MNQKLRKKLIDIARKKQVKGDPSHDFEHVLRVLHLVEKIGKKEKADIDVVVPAALFHDIVVYKKDSKESKNEAEESAQVVAKVLKRIKGYPNEKISLVQTCIRQCSFSKNIRPELLEAKVLQDADLLEATGAISIMRTFASSGQMGRQFYDPKDPFRKKSKAVPFGSGVDLFYRRLLIAKDRMHSKYAKQLAIRRTKFLKDFLKHLKRELKESGRL